MKGFVNDIEKLTEENENFRRVLYTGRNLQLVLMTLQPGEEIGEEVHDDRDQFFRFETGEGEVRIDGVANRVEADSGVIVPAGARHNIVNTGSQPLCLYTIYGPPEHVDGTVHRTKLKADHGVARWAARRRMVQRRSNGAGDQRHRPRRASSQRASRSIR
jgi:mannose-6-phosphate isomerase-like protein (cupin superfamily)